MIRAVVASDVDLAQKLIKEFRSDAEIVKALGVRGVPAEKALDLVQELRRNGLPTRNVLVPLQVEPEPHGDESAEPPPQRDPLWVPCLEVFLILFLLYDTWTFHLLAYWAAGYDFSHWHLGLLRQISFSLQQVAALGFMGYVLFRRSRSGRRLPRALSGAHQRSSRFVLVFELVMVLSLAFQTSVFSSFRILMENPGLPDAPTAVAQIWFREGHDFVNKAGGLALLGYVLYRGSRSFADLGLHWTMKDIALALPLLVGQKLLFQLTFPFARWSSEAMAGHELSLPDLGLYLDGTTLVMAHLLPLLLNGFYEELIVRGYLMTVVGKLTNSGVLAIGLSVIVQVSYHFYQGSPHALSHIGWCLLFSCFYWKTKRLLPVALAHFLSNFTSFLQHGARLAI